MMRFQLLTAITFPKQRSNRRKLCSEFQPTILVTMENWNAPATTEKNRNEEATPFAAETNPQQIALQLFGRGTAHQFTRLPISPAKYLCMFTQ